MRFFAPIATIGLLASSAIAAPTLNRRETSAASIESLASSFATTLSTSQAKLSSYIPTSTTQTAGSAQLSTLINSLSSSLTQAESEFKAIGSSGSSANPDYLAGAMTAQLSSLNSTLTSSQTQVSKLATSDPGDALSVAGLDALLTALLGGSVSQLFNSLGDSLEALDLPPL